MNCISYFNSHIKLRLKLQTFQRPPPPCGLPPFLEDLPSDVQTKITEIWKDYKEGDKCYEEQGLTREIMESLPKDVRKSIHKRPPLPFLRGLPKDILAKFDAIFKDKSIPFSEKPEKIDALAQEVLTGDNLKKFQEFKEKKEKEMQEYKDKVRIKKKIFTQKDVEYHSFRNRSSPQLPR